MRLKTAIITLITIFTSSVLLANTLSLGDNGDGTWNVNYSSDGAIGGFQFNVDGATINSASGGAAGDAGFMVSSSATTALGFSLSGATLPAGDGVLVVLDLEGTPEGLSGIVVADAVGQDMGFTYDSGVVATCDDESACNTGEEGDCEYPGDGLNCDSIPTEFDFNISTNHHIFSLSMAQVKFPFLTINAL